MLPVFFHTKINTYHNHGAMRGDRMAFTMVELLLVVTLLTVLSTLAIFSFRGYVTTTRDATRVATLKEIENGLGGLMAKTGKYPLPDGKIEIVASGSLLFYQGSFGDDNAQVVHISPLPRDPLDKTPYFYSVSESQKTYELLAFFESDTKVSILPKSYASKNENPIILGKNVGMILDDQKQMPQVSDGAFDVLQDTSTGGFVLYLKDQEPLEATGSLLFSTIVTQSDDLPVYVNTDQLDDTLLASYDMETMTLLNSKALVKDLTSSQANISCYHNQSHTRDSVSCTNYSGPTSTGGWKYPQKALSFGEGDSFSFGEARNTILDLDLSGYTLVFVAKIPAQSESLFVASAWNYPMFYVGFGNGQMTNVVIRNSQTVKTESFEVPVGEYFLGTLVFENDTLTTYINGKNEGVMSIAPATQGNYYINDFPYYPQFFRGEHDTLKIYKRALSLEEVKSIYDSLKP